MALNGWKKGRNGVYHKDGNRLWVATTPRVHKSNGKFCVAISYYDSPPSFVAFTTSRKKANECMKIYMEREFWI
jgi:hypothetical protein